MNLAVYIVCISALMGQVLAADDITSEIDNLVVQVLAMEQKLDTLDRNKERFAFHMRHLKIDVEHMDPKCERYFEYNCGGTHPVCVAYYLLCDGTADCPNGADENICSHQPCFLKPGAVMSLYGVNENNKYGASPGMHSIVKDIITADYFPAVPEMSAVSYIGGSGEMRVTAWIGFYNHGDDSLTAWATDFPGVDYGMMTCTGDYETKSFFSRNYITGWPNTGGEVQPIAVYNYQCK